MICRIAAGIMLVALSIGRIAPADAQGTPPAKLGAKPSAADAQGTLPAKPDGDPALVWATYLLVGATGLLVLATCMLVWVTKKLVSAENSIAVETNSLVNATEALVRSTKEDFKRKKELETVERWGEIRSKIVIPTKSRLKIVEGEWNKNTGQKDRNNLRQELRLLEFFCQFGQQKPA